MSVTYTPVRFLDRNSPSRARNFFTGHLVVVSVYPGFLRWVLIPNPRSLDKPSDPETKAHPGLDQFGEDGVESQSGPTHSPRSTLLDPDP